MKKIAFWILFFGFGFFSNAQSSLPKKTSDSLWGVWIDPNKADTLRLQAINKYVRDGYLNTNSDSTIYFAQLQYNFALQKNIKGQMANASYSQGVAFFYKGEYIKALEYFSESFTLFNELGDKKGMATAGIGIGGVHKDRGDYTEALDYYSRSLKLFEEIASNSGMGIALNNLGIIYKNQGDYKLALDYYFRSLKIKEETGDKKGIASTLSNIGIVYKTQGDYPKALEYYLNSLSIEDQIGNKNGQASSYVSIGNLYNNQGDNSKAREFYAKALLIFQELKNKIGIATVLNNIGICFQDAGDISTALDYYSQSLKIAEEIGDKKGTGAALNNMAALYKKNDGYIDAIMVFSKSLKIKESIGEKPGIIYSLNGLGSCHLALGQFRESILYCEKAMKMAIEMKSPEQINEACRTLILAFVEIQEKDSAAICLSILKTTVQQNLNTNYFSLSEREKEFYFATMEADFGRYFDFTLAFNNDFPNLLDTAYNLALLNKGLSLKSSTAMRLAISTSEDSSLVSDYEKWIMLKKKIARINSTGMRNELVELEDEANKLEKELVKRSSLFSDFEKVKNLDWKNVASSLEPTECAIEFIHFKSELEKTNPVIYAALLIKPESEHPEIIRLCNESELVDIIGNFQGNNINFVNAVYGTNKLAQIALYQKIWLPMEKYLDGVKSIYYSPTGLLHKISLAAIMKSQNVFLCDVYKFRQMSSTGNVAIQEDVAFGELENFLLMGGVNYNTTNSSQQTWSYLPGSLQEADAINVYLQKKNYGVNYFKESNASEDIFKEKIVSSSIVHIATHGFFFPDPEKVREEMKADSESNQDLKFRGSTNYANWSFVNNKNPLMRSGIVLAGANDVWERDALAEGEDGILTAQEVSNLDLRNTKLVVLSACETGLGDIKGSEGVFGLQRAFKMAGVKYLIMSLWQVPDKETSEFMILFYKNLIKLKDIPTAFQKTQKIMRKLYDPYYWGAFVLIE